MRALSVLLSLATSACLADANPLFGVHEADPSTTTGAASTSTLPDPSTSEPTTADDPTTSAGSADGTDTTNATATTATTGTPPECAGDAVRPCYSGPAETRGQGRCKDGTETCIAGDWGVCVDEILPTTEDCDTPDDDDCDGVPNDGCPTPDCQPGDVEGCYTGPPGTKNVGICKPGQSTCEGGQWGPCDNQVLPADELCDPPGADENCNSEVDELCGPCEQFEEEPCYEGPEGTNGVGVCHGGVSICMNGIYGPCMGQALPGVEDCNSPMDEDCNGNAGC